jgi:hypothetical protein
MPIRPYLSKDLLGLLYGLPPSAQDQTGDKKYLDDHTGKFVEDSREPESYPLAAYNYMKRKPFRTGSRTIGEVIAFLK